MYFSIPSDFKEETINKLEELNAIMFGKAKVIETYGQATVTKIPNSGRVTATLPKVDLFDLERYVKYSMNRGIRFNYTLNPSCFGNYEFTKKGIKELMAYIKTLNSIGIQSLTVTSPAIFELINASGLKFNIKASAICEIMTPDKALFYKNLGADRIVLDPDITRDFRMIHKIYQGVQDGLEIIINNVCIKNCAYKMFHYNHEAHCHSNHEGQDIKDYFTNRCSMQKARNEINPLRINWIRPEDLHYYEEVGIRYFKLQGRQNVLTGNIIKTLKYYMQKSFDGNLFDLITLFSPYNAFQPYLDNKSLDGFINKFLEEPCDSLCEKCGYCETYAQKSLNKEKTAKINQKAIQFFSEYDAYQRETAREATEKEMFREFETLSNF